MKIQENTSQYSLHGLSAATDSFAPWMHITNQHSGSAYYWQHQHHLQPSDLQFGTNLSQKSTVCPQYIHKKYTGYSPDFSSKKVSVQTHSPTSSLRKKMPNITAGFSILLTKKPAYSLIKNAYICFIKKPCKTPVFLYNNHKSSKQNMQVKPSIPLFKKQRIFQEHNQLEISINWRDFHKKPTAQQSLQQLTNWFLQQGLTIKKWIINGVMQ